jgi:hypothetical protein
MIEIAFERIARVKISEGSTHPIGAINVRPNPDSLELDLGLVLTE